MIIISNQNTSKLQYCQIGLKLHLISFCQRCKIDQNVMRSSGQVPHKYLVEMFDKKAITSTYAKDTLQTLNMLEMQHTWKNL